MAVVLLAAVLLLSAPASAEMLLPPGFTVKVYVSGEGFDGTRAAAGIPSSSTLAFDPSGVLYLARNGRRYQGGEVEDIWPVYRVPLGGGRLGKAAEGRFLYGPPLPNPQVGIVRGDQELLVTTYDRDRALGVLYRIVDGRAQLVAGGTPPRGEAPVLKQPEGVALDPAGNLYVADRAQNVVVQLDPQGRLLDARWLSVPRPRLVVSRGDRIWVSSDGDAPRAVIFAPDTEATRRAGIAGDLFVILIRRGTFTLNEIVRVSGPFDSFARSRLPASR
jgi:hypothetical protein